MSLRILILTSCGCLALPACQTDSRPPLAATAQEEQIVSAAGVEVPTQEEADAEAAAAISQENADAEFQRLLRELRNQ